MQSVSEIREKPLPDNIDELRALIAKLCEYSQSLETKVFLLERHKWSSKSEKFIHPNQQTFFNEAESLNDEPFAAEKSAGDQGDEEAAPTEVAAYTRSKRRPQIELPDNLPRETCIHTLSGDDLKCDCCGADMGEIGEEIVKKVHVIPAKVR